MPHAHPKKRLLFEHVLRCLGVVTLKHSRTVLYIVLYLCKISPVRQGHSLTDLVNINVAQTSHPTTHRSLQV
jgi:hypothetical protein